MKDSGVKWLGEIPEHWKVSKLGYITKKIGSGKTPRGGAEVYSDTGILFLRSQNIYDEGLFLDDIVRISKEINDNMENTQVKSGDILLNVTGGSIGRTTIVPDYFEKANVNQHVCIIRLNSSKYRAYISLVMKSLLMKTQIDAIQNGAAREGLNFEQIAGFRLAIPPVNEQNEIVDFIDNRTSKIDNLISKATKAIELLKEKRIALISSTVTGKIDVRGIS
jgi:type I restriction enzyme S subunit